MYLESGRLLNKVTLSEYGSDDWIVFLIWTFISKINSSPSFMLQSKKLCITVFVPWLLM